MSKEEQDFSADHVSVDPPARGFADELSSDAMDLNEEQAKVFLKRF